MASDVLSIVRDKSSAENIQAIAQCFVRQLDPLKVFLFGSFAVGKYTDESDYDFYIVIPDGASVGEASDKAYKSIRYVQDCPVDIVVGTKSRFDRIGPSQDSLFVEGEVYRNGILLYDRAVGLAGDMAV